MSEKNIGFHSADILLPKSDFDKFSCIACDQYTSEPDYWEDVKNIVGTTPSALNLIFPEVYLDTADFDSTIANINSTMNSYLEKGVFNEFADCLIYTRRTLPNKKVREGLIGVLDLELYDFNKGSKSLIRATEGTILDRLPPRIKIRENAPIELPHILILIDDRKKTVIEPLSEIAKDCEKLYDFDLMKEAGHIEGYKLNSDICAKINDALAALIDKDAYKAKYGDCDSENPLLFAVGDGNHSLATAKRCYEKVKEELGDKALSHPARYALVELNNLHSDCLEFEAIHRSIFNIDNDDFINKFNQYAFSLKGEEAEQTIRILNGHMDIEITIDHPTHPLAVGTVQEFIDSYLAEHEGKLDYIHGEDTCQKLTKDGAVSIVLPSMHKNDLFLAVIKKGALPRKTFSMGHASDKRFYLECRKIK